MCRNADHDPSTRIGCESTRTFIHKGVCVLLQQQVVQNSTLGHEPEEIVVAAKEDMQAHLPIQKLASVRPARQQVRQVSM